MKSKITIYLLVIAVLAVWGVIIKKIFFSTPEQPNVRPREIAVTTHSEEKEALLLNYRDPFGAMGTENPIHKPVATKAYVKSAISKPQYEQFNVHFVGRINHNISSFYIIEFNGSQYTIAIGDEINGFRLVSVNANGLHFTKNRLDYHIAF